MITTKMQKVLNKPKKTTSIIMIRSLALVRRLGTSTRSRAVPSLSSISREIPAAPRFGETFPWHAILAAGALGLAISSVSTEGKVDVVEVAKEKAAIQAVDDHVRTGMVVGIGSGSTVVYAVNHIAKLVGDGTLSDVSFVPSSFQARQLIIDAKLPLTDLERNPLVDVVIDGADEVDDRLNCIKGGGGCHTLEKLLIANAVRFIVVADHRKQSSVLGEQWHKGVPIEVLPSARVVVTRAIERLGGKATLRPGAPGKAGPIVTDSGNLILDCDFGKIKDPQTLNLQLVQIPGVVETGLFPLMAAEAYFGQPDGTVKHVHPYES